MSYYTTNALAHQATGTKIGSGSRQQYIQSVVEDIIDSLNNCTLSDNPEFVRFVDIWVKPQLGDIKRAAAGHPII